MSNMQVELYTDGSCLGNPGPGGAGYVIKYWEFPEGDELPIAKDIKGNKGFKFTTNNRMEIMAGICGFEEVASLINNQTLKNINQITMSTDSKYLCDAVNQRWIDKWQRNNWMTSGFQGATPKPVKNKDLWTRLIGILDNLRSMNINVNINHIPGHQGYEFNEMADQLAVSAAKGNDLLPDEEYERNSSRK